MGLVDQLMLINQNKGDDFRIDENGVMMFKDRIYVPDVPELKKSILEEGHRSGLSIHWVEYKDLKKLLWWSGMKIEVAEFFYACLTCQKSKVKHQKPSGLVQPLDIS